jgi:transcriptional regulator with XRE-family HTH domain
MPEQDFNKIVRTNIKAELARQELSSADLARRLKTTPRKIQNRLSGITRLSATDVEEISRALEVPVSQFGFPLVTTAGQGVRS